MPAGLQRLIDKRLQPSLSWRELLARFVDNSARSDYSWITPNTRYLHLDLYFPALKNNELGEVVVAIDTSGSITQAELESFAAEVSEIFNQHPATVHLLHCDLKVTSSSIYDRGNLPDKIVPKGGGGTDYRPVFQYIETHTESPSCLIYLTDHECISYPAEEPPYPVLWVKTGDSDRKPPFGETVAMPAPLTANI